MNGMLVSGNKLKILTKYILRDEVTNETMSNLTKPSLREEVTNETMSNLTKPSLREEVTNETMSNLTKPSLPEEVTNETDYSNECIQVCYLTFTFINLFLNLIFLPALYIYLISYIYSKNMLKKNC